MDYVILASGLGERLQPLTSTTPKALLKVFGKPLLHWHLKKIYQPQNNIFVNTSWLSAQIHTYIQTHFPRVQCIYEGKKPLGTGGGLLNIYQQASLTQGVTVINADIFCDYNFRVLSYSSIAHLVMVDNPPHNIEGDFGLIEGQLSLNSQVKKTYAGIAFLQYEFIAQLQQHNLTQKVHSFIPFISRLSQQQKISAEMHKGFWFDVGTQERLQQANNFAQQHKFD